MAMKKIKPQYGKVVPPAVGIAQNAESGTTDESREIESKINDGATGASGETQSENVESQATEKAEVATPKKSEVAQKSATTTKQKGTSRLTSEPNPFLQTKEIFGKARLTKVGYRVRTDFVEILDFIKKMKKNGYTLEAVLDDALAFYFENSEDGREAIKKAEIFYS
jgi:hypothetical protein